jgi:iron complex outermembrane recepter protein
MNQCKQCSHLALLLALSCIFNPPLFAQGTAGQYKNAQDYDKLNLEQLLAIEVSSVSKKSESLQDAAASIYIITSEDIRRSGATRLVEVLAMAPGAFFHDNSYNYSAEAIRNGSKDYSQTILILLDGVPLTQPLTAGMTYYNFDIPLQQIDRIEVIKGPGGTIYGANANTGVVNIYTKSAKKTEGTRYSFDTSSLNYYSPFMNINGRIGKASLSGYLKFVTTSGYDKTAAFSGPYVDQPGQTTASQAVPNHFPSNETDGRQAESGGANIQMQLTNKLSSNTHFFFSHVSSNIYTQRVSDPTAPVAPLPYVSDEAGIDAIASQRFEYAFNNKHTIFSHTYVKYNYLERGLAGGVAGSSASFESEVQDNHKLGIHDLSVGANLRAVKFSALDAKKDILFTAQSEMDYLYAGFIQDKIALGSKVEVTGGVKLEGWTLVDNIVRPSPSVRFSFKLSKDVTLWSAYSRSITIPGFIQSRMEFRLSQVPYITPQTAAVLADRYGLTGTAKSQFIAQNTTSPLFLPNTTKLYVAIISHANVQPTVYNTAELGWRAKLHPKVYMDFSGFYAKLDKGIDSDTNFKSKPPVASEVAKDVTIWPIYYNNTYKGRLYGWDAVFKLQPLDHLRFEASHSLFKRIREGLPIPGSPGAAYSIDDSSIPTTPQHIVRLRPYLDFPKIGLYLASEATFYSKYDRGDPFNYILQVAASNSASGITGINADPAANLWKVGFSIEKSIGASKWQLIFWGRNVSNSPYVEGFSQWGGVQYPHTVNRSFGGGLSYRY